MSTAFSVPAVIPIHEYNDACALLSRRCQCPRSAYRLCNPDTCFLTKHFRQTTHAFKENPVCEYLFTDHLDSYKAIRLSADLPDCAYPVGLKQDAAGNTQRLLAFLIVPLETKVMPRLAFEHLLEQNIHFQSFHAI